MSSDHPGTRHTPLPSIPLIIEQARHDFLEGHFRPLEARVTAIRLLARLMIRNKSRFADALRKDLGRSEHLTELLDIQPVLLSAEKHLANLEAWTKDEPKSRGLLWAFDSVKVRKEAKGVVAIIAPWNYPLQLLLIPAIAAMASGNAVVLKPSEVSHETTNLLVRLIQANFKENCQLSIIHGGVEHTTEMLRHPFDHIFYTGNGKVGRVVMEAAARHLTPVTLELGGKCPVVVAGDAHIGNAARRIVWGKFLNAGQTCIAPDYAIVEKKQVKPFITAVQEAIKQLYTETPKASPDYGRIVSERHWDRLHGLASEQGLDVRMVGTPDRESRFFPPTLVVAPSETARCMQEEIFGPILAIIPVKEIYKDSVKWIRSHPNPLALYIFSNETTLHDYVTESCNSGAVLINDTVIHVSIDSIPFGGVGQSGMGAYHDKYGFDTFTHERAVVHRSSGLEFMNELRYPPLDTPVKLKALEMFAYAKSKF